MPLGSVHIKIWNEKLNALVFVKQFSDTPVIEKNGVKDETIGVE